MLLEQLAHDHFKTGLVGYMHERIALARHDANEFEKVGEKQLLLLAHRWEQWYADRLAHFEKIGRDIPGAFAGHLQDGRIEILTSAATHAYLPLLTEDACVSAQLSAGTAISQKHFGQKLTGLWLPECAYRPATSAWRSPVLYREPRARAGLETHIAAHDLSHFFVDTHLVSLSQPLAITDDSGTRPVSEALIFWDNRRGWGNPLDPVGVASVPSTKPANVFAFARHPRVSEQVWSGIIGYPGADAYLEFHRKQGENGLRYHRVTSHHTPAIEKLPYDPDQVAGTSYEQAQHFCTVLREVLSDYTKQTGRIGTIVAPFDAELFGHWWFEGFAFLRDVMLSLSHQRDIEMVTAQSALSQSTLDKVVQMTEGSWGEGGHHLVWLNDHSKWLWETEHRAEMRFRKLLGELPWQTDPKVEAMLKKAARELLLLQSSDWPFAIHSGAAADYGISRFALHATRFDRLATIACMKELTAVQQTEVAEADAHDVVFDDLKLEWWVG